jgi:putative component of membrane protein insertase Oxa1/YidC/SpoIIIJ protein YidD
MKLSLSLLFLFLSPVIVLSQEANNERNNAFLDYIRLYQKNISFIRNSHCPMYPSCSVYGYEAFKGGNAAKAFMLTADRLLRCGHDHKFYNLTQQSDNFLLLDPAGTETNNSLIYRPRRSFYAVTAPGSVQKDSTGFIKYLIDQGQYQEALKEIHRILYFTPQSSNVDLYANYLICLRALEQQEKAIFEYENTFPASVRSHPVLMQLMGNQWLSLDNYDNAISLYGQVIKDPETERHLGDQARILRGYAHVRKADLELAKSDFSSIVEQSVFFSSAQANLSQLEKISHLKYKKPALAGVLGVVPGLGYLYASHKQTALSAFVVNGLLGFATYTSIRTHNYGLAALTGVFGASFYIGNISGSVKSVRRYNQNKYESQVRKIKTNVNF